MRIIPARIMTPHRLGSPGRGAGLFTTVLGNGRPHLGLLVAAARHEVFLVSYVFVLAFAAVELVGPPIPLLVKKIAAIPAVEDVLAIASENILFVAGSPVDDIIASGRAIIASQEGVVARPSIDDVVAGSSLAPRPRILSSPSRPARLSGLSVPKSRPPLGQPGKSFVVKCSPHFSKVRVPWHRASSSDAVASGELPCSFLLEGSEGVPAQPTTRRRKAPPIRMVPTTAMRCTWRTTAHPPSAICAS